MCVEINSVAACVFLVVNELTKWNQTMLFVAATVSLGAGVVSDLTAHQVTGQPLLATQPASMMYIHTPGQPIPAGYQVRYASLMATLSSSFTLIIQTLDGCSQENTLYHVCSNLLYQCFLGLLHLALVSQDTISREWLACCKFLQTCCTVHLI